VRHQPESKLLRALALAVRSITEPAAISTGLQAIKGYLSRIRKSPQVESHHVNLVQRQGERVHCPETSAPDARSGLFALAEVTGRLLGGPEVPGAQGASAEGAGTELPLALLNESYETEQGRLGKMVINIRNTRAELPALDCGRSRLIGKARHVGRMRLTK